MEESAVSLPDGALSHLEKLEASAHQIALKQGEIKEHEEKVIRMKAKIQELRRQRDELKTKLNVCLSQFVTGKDAPKSSFQASQATETNQQAMLEWKIENAKALLQVFHLTGLSGKLTKQGACLTISTAFEGTYLDSYYLDILIQQPLQIQHHSVPFFIPLEQIAHEHLQKDIKRFLSVISDHLNAYAGRKFQVDQLKKFGVKHLESSAYCKVVDAEELTLNEAKLECASTNKFSASIPILEHFAIFLEGCLQGNYLCNQLEFYYRVTDSGTFPFTANIIYGNPMNALPTKVTVQCKEDTPVYMAERAAVHLALFYEKPLHKVFSSIIASAEKLNQPITRASSLHSMSGNTKVSFDATAL